MKLSFKSRLAKLEKSLLKPSIGGAVILFETVEGKMKARYINMSPTEKWTNKGGGMVFLPVKKRIDDEEENEIVTRNRCELTDSFLEKQPELREYLKKCDYL